MKAPRELFQESLGPESSFRNVIKSAEMEKAITYALAQYGKENPSSEEMYGANRFVQILTNLGERAQPPRRPPEKRLNYSVLQPVQPPTKDKKDGEKK